MAQKDCKEAPLTALLASVSGVITYRPLRTEIQVPEHFAIPAHATVYEVLPRASLDPVKEVAQARTKVGAGASVVFLPGRRFDHLGTRLGQGGGWYDRFLSAAPVEWLRVGFCFNDQFSPTPLPRQSWDESVDIVCVVNRATGVFMVVETRARMPAFLGN